MKYFLNIKTLLLFLFTINISVYSQEKELIEENIKRIEQGLIKGDFTIIEPILSSKYEVAGYKQPIANQVTQQIINQYPKLKSIQTLAIEQNKAKIEYDFELVGKKTSNILFDETGKIETIELFDNILNQSIDTRKGSTHEKIESFTTKFELVKNLIFIKVNINGKEENFILDSGAPTTVLNSKHFETKETGTEIKGVTGSTNLNYVELESLNWNGIITNDTKVISMDLSHLEKSTEREFKGLIGQSLLKEYELYLDYNKKELTVTSKVNGEWNTNKKPSAEFEFQYGGHIPIIVTKIDGKDFKFGLDTGASRNLLEKEGFTKLSKEIYKSLGSTNLLGADKNSKEINSIEISECSINNIVLKEMAFVISDISHLKDGYNLDINGLLGYPFLSQQKISIDFKNQKIYLW
jgi:predicted aspartyl protease